MATPVHRSMTHVTVARKNFMIVVMTALLGFVTLGYVGAVLAYLIPRKGEGARAQDLGPISQFSFTAGVAGPFVYDATGRGDAQGVFAVQTGSNANAVNLVLEQTCRHLGCPVAWTPSGSNTGTFNCPCHGSVFAKDGARISGPTPAGLYKHDFQVTNGRLIVKGRQG